MRFSLALVYVAENHFNLVAFVTNNNWGMLMDYVQSQGHEHK